MEKINYNIGMFNPCLYKHPAEDISVLRHGDDFATLATRTQIVEFKEDLSKHKIVKHIATLGPRPQLVDSCEVRFLNRVIPWVVPSFGKAQEPIEIETDPRHAELLVKNSGLQSNSKRVNTPGERPKDSSRTVKLHHKMPTYQQIELSCSLPVQNLQERWRDQHRPVWKL